MKTTFFFVISVLFIANAAAQVPPDTFYYQDRKLHYMGDRVRTMEEMKSIVLTLNDPIATRHIKAAKRLRTMGFATVIGTAIIGTVVTINAHAHNYNPVSFLLPGTVGCNLMLLSSRKHRNKARLRYNDVVMER